MVHSSTGKHLMSKNAKVSHAEGSRAVFSPTAVVKECSSELLKLKIANATVDLKASIVKILEEKMSKENGLLLAGYINQRTRKENTMIMMGFENNEKDDLY